MLLFGFTGQKVHSQSLSQLVGATEMETNRSKWRSLTGINLFDGLTYQIAMSPTARQDKVIPESFRIILRQYLRKPEVKSLAPDGSLCVGTTEGLLRRTKIVAGGVIPVGKETDRRWEQGEDPSMLDSKIHVYETPRNMAVAEPAERKSWAAVGVRRLMRKSGLSQKTIYKILAGDPVRRDTLSSFRQAIDRITI